MQSVESQKLFPFGHCLMPQCQRLPLCGTAVVSLIIRTPVRHWPSAHSRRSNKEKTCLACSRPWTDLRGMCTQPCTHALPAQPVGVLTCSSKDEICHRYILKTSSRQLASKTSSSVTSWQDRAGYKRGRQLSQNIRKCRTSRSDSARR